MEQQSVLQSHETEKFNFNDFLKFKIMITTKILPIFYLIGAVLITISGLFLMFAGGSASKYSSDFSVSGMLMGGGFFMGLIYIVLGNIFWRIWCEFLMVLFTINGGIKNIEKNTRK